MRPHPIASASPPPAGGQIDTPTDAVIVVSGLPRSGTSLMMQMLEVAGVPLCTDGLRAADADNPRGYYEYEPATRLKEDSTWVAHARGQAVKVVSPLLFHLPPGVLYRILFMQRNMEEILASQQAMLMRRQAADSAAADDALMAQHFRDHLRQASDWLTRQAHMSVLHVRHDDLLTDPVAQAQRVADFLGLPAEIEPMAAVVDSGLHRQRCGDSSGDAGAEGGLRG